jgi:hypothetical protein
MITEKQRLQLAAGIPTDLTEGNLSDEVNAAGKELQATLYDWIDKWKEFYDYSENVRKLIDAYEEVLYDDEGQGLEKYFDTAYSNAYDDAIKYHKTIAKVEKTMKKVF